MNTAIQQWNPVAVASGDVRASFYIQPTLALLQFLNRKVENGNQMALVQITGTGHTVYDGGELFATIDTSAFPNGRQNFYNSTHYLIVTLSVDWLGYPPENGRVTFLEGVVAESHVESVESVEPSAEHFQDREVPATLKRPLKKNKKVTYSDSDSDSDSDEDNDYNDYNDYTRPPRTRGQFWWGVTGVLVILLAIGVFAKKE